MSPSLSLWSPPPEQPELASGQVHLWRFRLDLPADKISELSQFSSYDEQLRAKRLLDRLKADSFIVARGRLRQILSRYLNLEPIDITFAYGEHGKPYLANGLNKNLSFNLSHTGHWGLLAVSLGAEIGIDIEQIDRQIDYEKIATNFFSPAEIDELEQYSLIRRHRAFYRLWTRKEAGLKMTGSGFSAPGKKIRPPATQIRSFTINRNYLGAVAISDIVDLILRVDLT